jgi:hypothetical protein
MNCYTDKASMKVIKKKMTRWKNKTYLTDKTSVSLLDEECLQSRAEKTNSSPEKPQRTEARKVWGQAMRARASHPTAGSGENNASLIKYKTRRTVREGCVSAQ